MLPASRTLPSGDCRTCGQVTHTTFALGIARAMDMIFWMVSYKELTSERDLGSKSVGMFVLLAQFVHIVVMGDFFYYYAIRWVVSERSVIQQSLWPSTFLA